MGLAGRGAALSNAEGVDLGSCKAGSALPAGRGTALGRIPWEDWGSGVFRCMQGVRSKYNRSTAGFGRAFPRPGLCLRRASDGLPFGVR